MSVTNYEASAYNHSEILICVQCVGNLQERYITEALVKIRKHSKLTIADAGRTVHFRFELNTSPENSKWGHFQPHRRVMGLLVLAECSSALDVALLHETFQKKKEAFSDCIYDSRCFVFGVANDVYLQPTKGEVFQFIDVQSWKISDTDIKEFLTSVFYVLESKRLQIAADKSERPPLLAAPFEKSQSSSSDADSRSHRKKSLGRWRKYLADISLLAGLRMEALLNYRSALELLVAVNDQVWIGGVLEGLCVASAIIIYGTSKSMPRSPIAKQSNKQVLDPKNLIGSKMSSSSSTAELVKHCIQAPDDFVDRYKEAVINYSRSEYMGVVELEACIKATKVLATMNKSMQAAEFLQNAVYIALKVPDEERIVKYSALASLYAEINFHRKSAFYRRVAAMQCVAPQLERADWKNCYSLLKGTFEGYNLNILTDSGLPACCSDLQNEFGWPHVRLRVLYELVFSAKRNGNMRAANRYVVYLLMRLHQYLTETEEKEACSSLEASASAKDKNLKSPDGMLLPPLNLYNLPTVCDVIPQPLSAELQPCTFSDLQTSSSVFLFAPASYQTAHKKLKHIDFKWCVNSQCEVRVKLQNMLRVHTLRVSNFKLLCEDSKSREDTMLIECHETTVNVPPRQTVETKLLLVPKTEGTIHITGYEATVFGVQSKCFFRNMPWISVDEFEVDVTPEIPLLQRTSQLPHGVVSKKKHLSLTLYLGETRLLKFSFINKSDIPVTDVDVQCTKPTVNRDITTFKAKSSMSRLKAKWLSVNCGEVGDEMPLGRSNIFSLPVFLSALGKTDDDVKDMPDCSSQIKMKYSCEKARKKNMCRSSVLSVMATLKPCLSIIKLHFKSASRQGRCVVMLEVANICEHSLIVCTTKLNEDKLKTEKDVEYVEDDLVLARLKPDDTQTIRMEIPNLVNCDVSKAEGIASSGHICSDKNDQSVNSSLQAQLNSILALTWRTTDEECLRKGNLDLSSYSLDYESITILTTSPLLWDFFVDDENVTNRCEYDCMVGEACSVAITMKNVSGFSINSIDVELEIFQDQGNGFREWNVEDCILCVGCQSQYFPSVEAGEEICFECTLVFLLSGSYHVRLHRLHNVEGNFEFKAATLKRTNSNQVHQETCNYKDFSPEVVITAKNF